jgi:dephospho-CoA kinase
MCYGLKKNYLFYMPKLIEIIGPPGSGKTFISKNLQNIKKKNKQVFYHSSDLKNFYRFQKLNFLTKFFIKFKVIIIIIKFYCFFYKRFFYKKIYKRGFFIRTILLIYRHIHSIEMLKKVLSNDEFLIMEPGIIMYFLQDYFYTEECLSKKEIKTFNKFFLNSQFIIYTSCNSKLQLERLKYRERGLPQRMRSLSSHEIKKSTQKANFEIKKYFKKLNDLNVKIVKINTSTNNIKIRKKLLKFIEKV